jgi:hypothetical protein
MAAMDNRFADDLILRVKELLESATSRLESRLGARIDGVESNLGARIDGVESQLSDLRAEVAEFRAATEGNYDNMSSRHDRFERRFANFEAKVFVRFDDVERRLTLVERGT